MSRQLTAIIVDDESLAREGLRLRLSSDTRIAVVAQCPSAQHALDAIQQFQPDVAFVDIEMPGITGLELAAQLETLTATPPQVVFVTGFKEFALNAFEFQAFDYLLKPISESRLARCLTKLTHALENQSLLQQHKKLNELLSQKTGNSINGFLHSLESSNGASLHELRQTLSLKCGNEWLRVKLANITWIEAAGDYMCVHTQDGTHIIRKTLKQFEQELNPQLFARVSRSAMINISQLEKLSPNANGEYLATLGCGETVKVSRKYKFKLDELRNHNN